MVPASSHPNFVESFLMSSKIWLASNLTLAISRISCIELHTHRQDCERPVLRLSFFQPEVGNAPCTAHTPCAAHVCKAAHICLPEHGQGRFGRRASSLLSFSIEVKSFGLFLYYLSLSLPLSRALFRRIKLTRSYIPVSSHTNASRRCKGGTEEGQTEET